jgi:prolyl-tRNA synthetase
MRLSHYFGRTLYEAPAEAEMISHQLALRAGLVRPVSAGLYAYLPLGWRALTKLAGILRQEMDALGAQEMLMPVDWKLEVRDWRLDVSPTSNIQLPTSNWAEVVTDIARRDVLSYRQLPIVVYHIQTTVGDVGGAGTSAPTPRGGLIRLRQFLMKDAYSLDADQAGLNAAYTRMVEAYRRIFTCCQIDFVEIEADVGVDGSGSHEFMAPHSQGDDTIIRCPGCGYVANVEQAVFDKRVEAASHLPESSELSGRFFGSSELEPVVEVATPGCETIAELAAFLGRPTWQTLKGVFYQADGRLIVVAIRGDLEVNEAKLANVLGATGAGQPQRVAPTLAPADADLVRPAGIEPGYGSPVGRPVAQTLDGEGLIVVADDSVPAARNLVAGANRPGYHLTGVNFGRDFSATVVADIALARAGDRCVRCGTSLSAGRGIELGHCVKPGTRTGELLGARYLDAAGRQQPIFMGSYRIGLDRLLAVVLERHHDTRGIVWPRTLAPFDAHLLSLGADPEVRTAAEAAYEQLHAAGLGVVYDDRDESAGIKFADADLIGLPVRITISRRSLKQGGAEVKLRPADQTQVVGLSELVDRVHELLAG